MLFKNKYEEDKDEEKAYENQQTTIRTAKEKTYFEPCIVDPRKYVNIEKGAFAGIHHINSNVVKNEELEIVPIYIPHKAVNHKLLCGITRSGKGVKASVMCYETLQFEKKGLIYFDVKTEEFTPQVIYEELKKQGRENDFLLVNFPNDFCYSGFNEDDTLDEIWQKICVALNIEKAKHEGVDHYRSVERMTLLKLLKVAWKKKFKSDWNEILFFIERLIEDFKNREKEDKELDKKGTINYDKIEQFEKRYFDNDFYKELNFYGKNIQALESIYIKLYELLMSSTIYTKHTIDEALYNGKVIYIKADMENQASLQFLKIVLKDISQRIRKVFRKNGKKANCDVYCDEISFYVDHKLAGALSTHGGFGVKYTLLLQDLGQIEDPFLKSSILTNCSMKLFYKISDLYTLEYVEKLGGNIQVSTHTLKGSNESSYSFNVEPLLNATQIRAMWYAQNAILIAEYFNTAFFTAVSFIPVENSFDWITRDNYEPDIQLKTIFNTSVDDFKAIETSIESNIVIEADDTQTNQQNTIVETDDALDEVF